MVLPLPGLLRVGRGPRLVLPPQRRPRHQGTLRGVRGGNRGADGHDGAAGGAMLDALAPWVDRAAPGGGGGRREMSEVDEVMALPNQGGGRGRKFIFRSPFLPSLGYKKLFIRDPKLDFKQ